MVFENAGRFHIGTAIFNIDRRRSRGTVLSSFDQGPTPTATINPAAIAAIDRTNLNAPEGPGLNDPLFRPNDPPPSTKNKPLDILFLQDATGSQGPYIRSARSAIQTICEKIKQSTTVLAENALRFGLIAFRDHPPEDRSFVTKNFGFTSDVDAMATNLAGLTATGGGDGPEAITTALAEALNMEWNAKAVKIVVLITDAPPHGLGEAGDGFPGGSPDQNDPCEIARQMADRGITLYVVACEPSLSTHYVNAVDFYRGICQVTSGRMIPLVNAFQLGDYIVGSAVETMETERLVDEYEEQIAEEVFVQGKPLEEVVQRVQERMTSAKENVTPLEVEDCYNPSPNAQSSADMWARCETIHARSSYPDHQPSRSTVQSRFTSGSSSGTGPSSYSTADEGTYLMRPPSPPPAPTMSLTPQPINRPHTERVVMQALGRHCRSEAGGVLRPVGRYEGSSAVSRDMISGSGRSDAGLLPGPPSAIPDDNAMRPRPEDRVRRWDDENNSEAGEAPLWAEKSREGSDMSESKMSVTASLKRRWSAFKLFPRHRKETADIAAADLLSESAPNKISTMFGRSQSKVDRV